MASSDSTLNFQDLASRDRMTRAFRDEADHLFMLASEPGRWNDPTACTGWELRDLVGHLVDASDVFRSGFERARSGLESPSPAAASGMAQATDEAARSFRSVSRTELLARLEDGTLELLRLLESLTDAEWTGLPYPDPFFGPLPPTIVVAGALGGNCVHGWDIQQGRGGPHALRGDTVDLLVPFVDLLLWATANTAGVEAPYAIGVRTSGPNGGEIRWDVSSEGVRYGPGQLSDCAAVLDFDPATYVLTGYGRVNSGTVRGDLEAAARFRSLFVPI